MKNFLLWFWAVLLAPSVSVSLTMGKMHAEMYDKMPDFYTNSLWKAFWWFQRPSVRTSVAIKHKLLRSKGRRAQSFQNMVARKNGTAWLKEEMRRKGIVMGQ